LRPATVTVLVPAEPIVAEAMVPPVTLPINPPTAELSASVPTLPVLRSVPESVPAVMLPNKPPRSLAVVPLMVPLLVNAPENVWPVTKAPMMPPMPVAAADAVTLPVFVKLLAMVNAPIVPKMPPSVFDVPL